VNNKQTATTQDIDKLEGALEFTVNRLILGDNYEILKAMDAESVDLIYLDPPFFSNRNYEVIWGDAGEIRSFQDRWSGGMEQYIGWLYERVEEMHRVLKPTGSIYLHCDWHADAYIRVGILDKIFGEKNFRNEIVWHYGGPSPVKTAFARKHDSIYVYGKGDAIFHPQYEDLPSYLKNRARQDPGGRLWVDQNLGKLTEDTISQMKSEGRVFETKTGGLRRKQYLDEMEGAQTDDVWDIPIINAMSKERIGYPTQKPEALLERIIKASSNKGDIVLDPFMGGGTTIAVADRLNRQWIGIDQSPAAVKVTELRLEKQADLFSSPYTVQLHKYDFDTLFNEDPFKFETWIIQQVGGVPQNRKGGDGGVDGKAADGSPIQVKQSKNIGVNVVKNFSVSAKQFNKLLFEKNVAAKKPVGCIIAFSFGRGAIEEAARLKNSENIIIRLVTVEEIVPLAVKPAVVVHIKELERTVDGARKIEFTAAGESPAGIEFYSWDFEYNLEKKRFRPSVIMDKDGKQIVSLDPGAYTIAVKVVDNNGLENVEVVKLKINGGVQRA
jgi:DNA modification methylase